MMGDIYIAAHLRRYLRHSVIGHVLQYTPSPSVLDALHLHHAVKSPPLRHPSPSHRAFIEAKDEPVKTKHVFQMKVNTHTTTHQKKKMSIDTHTIMYQAKFLATDIVTNMYSANFAAIDIETIMYQAKFAGGRSRLDLLLPSFLPSREEKKKQERRKQSIDSGAEWYTPYTDRVRTEKKKQERRKQSIYNGAEWHTPHMDRVRIETKMQEQIFCPLRGHSVGRIQYAPTSCRQERLFPINSREERIETKTQERRKQSIDSGAEWHTLHTDRVRTETKTQERIFCPLRGHAVGRMQYAPTSCRQERLFPINSQEERIETKMQEQKNHPSGSRGVLHTPHTDRVRIETKTQERRKQSINNGAEWHMPHTDRVRIETKKQEQIFCPLRGHAVGRMPYAPTSCRQERLFPINSQEERTETKMQKRRKQSIDSGVEWHTPHMDRIRTETKMQKRRNQSIDSGAKWHTPFMRKGERDAVWREAFWEQRARFSVWRDRRLEERSSHARLQLRTSGENSKPYKSSLVDLSEQLRDIFAAYLLQPSN